MKLQKELVTFFLGQVVDGEVKKEHNTEENWKKVYAIHFPDEYAESEKKLDKTADFYTKGFEWAYAAYYDGMSKSPELQTLLLQMFSAVKRAPQDEKFIEEYRNLCKQWKVKTGQDFDPSTTFDKAGNCLFWWILKLGLEKLRVDFSQYIMAQFRKGNNIDIKRTFKYGGHSRKFFEYYVAWANDKQKFLNTIGRKNTDFPLKSMLNWACAYGNSIVITALFEKGLQIDAKNLVQFARFIDLDAKDPYGQTPLDIAVLAGSVNAIDTLIERGADINQKGWNGLTPLQQCVSNNYLINQPENFKKHFWKVLKYLLEQTDAKTDVVDANGDTLLHRAAEAHFYPAMAKLKDKVDVNATNKAGKTAMEVALSAYVDGDPNKPSLLKTILALREIGADPNSKGEDGRTLFHWFAQYGTAEDAKRLGNDFSSVNLTQNSHLYNGFTALHIAVSQKNYAALKELVKLDGVDLNAKEDTLLKRTPLFIAVTEGDNEAVKILVAAGADVGLSNLLGQSALSFAKGKTSKISAEVVKLMEEAKENEAKKPQKTPEKKPDADKKKKGDTKKGDGKKDDKKGDTKDDSKKDPKDNTGTPSTAFDLESEEYYTKFLKPKILDALDKEPEKYDGELKAALEVIKEKVTDKVDDFVKSNKTKQETADVALPKLNQDLVDLLNDELKKNDAIKSDPSGAWSFVKGLVGVLLTLAGCFIPLAFEGFRTRFFGSDAKHDLASMRRGLEAEQKQLDVTVKVAG